MCSIPDKTRCVIVMVILALLLVGGCQRTQSYPPDRLSDEPLLIDEAMQARNWDRSVARYEHTGVVAGHTRQTFEVDDEKIFYTRPIVDPAVALLNYLIIPVTYITKPPGQAVVHRGVTIPPTYSGMPAEEMIAE